MSFTESSLIESIRRLSAGRKKGLSTGIGDDCAVIKLPSGHEALVTTDFSLEGVHFRREWHSPDAVGHRCLARGLSDIAAMGGEPRAAFLSLALPAKLPRKWVDGFLVGFLKLAGEFGVPLAGGDTAQSPDDRVLADVVVLGSAPSGKAILRSTARAGDLLYVTGDLGMPLATLEKLQQGRKVAVASHAKHFYPQPRLAVGRFLRERHLANAMIDISDGLSTDLSHICAESGVGAVVYAEALPLAGAKLKAGKPLGEDEADDSPFRVAADESASGHGFSRAEGSLQTRGTELGVAAGSRLRTPANQPVSGHGFSRAEIGAPRLGALAPAALRFALHGGDEYELLFTARPGKAIPKTIAGIPITRIGEILPGHAMTLATADGRTAPLRPQGWQHFGKRS